MTGQLSPVSSHLQTERPPVSTAASGDVPHVPASLRTPQQRSERIKLRRGLALLAMTLVMPGSAQVSSGHQRVGRLAVRIWAGVWALLLVLGVLALVWRSGAIALFTYPPALRAAQIVLIALGIGWGLLFIDAWRISRPPELARRHRLGFAALNLGLVFVVTGGLLASASMVSAQRDLMGTVFAGGGDHEVKAGRYNILLLGGDAGKDRTGLRPDSMTVASVDAETGRTVLISLPRNLEDVPFPDSSPLHKKFPHGYSCPDHSCMLNAVYTYATEHKELYPGVANPGAQATKEAVEGATGLTINYWVLIDLKGFEQLVDAVGGITMDVYRRVPIGGGHVKIYGYVEAGKNRHLDGREALWFARSRSDSSDYDRMVRQKCVMNAMLDQLDPLTVLTKFNKIASASQEFFFNDMATSEIYTMLGLAEKAKALPVSSLAVVPPLIQPGAPNIAKIHTAVTGKVNAAEAADAPRPTPTLSPTPTPQTTSAGEKSTEQKSAGKKAANAGKAGTNTDNLTDVCSA